MAFPSPAAVYLPQHGSYPRREKAEQKARERADTVPALECQSCGALTPGERFRYYADQIVCEACDERNPRSRQRLTPGTARCALVSKHQRAAVGRPLCIASNTEGAYHVGKLALRPSQRWNNTDTSAVIVAASEGDLPSVGRPIFRIARYSGGMNTTGGVWTSNPNEGCIFVH